VGVDVDALVQRAHPVLEQFGLDRGRYWRNCCRHNQRTSNFATRYLKSSGSV